MNISSSRPKRPVLRYHGGKYVLAEWIVSYLPPHKIYTESFGGVASVLMAKPRSTGEVYNDLDGEVVNLFRVLRDSQTRVELETQLRFTPYARAEFDAATLGASDSIERARRCIVRGFMGFGASSCGMTPKSIGFRSHCDASAQPAQGWLRYIDALHQFTARLAGVLIENRIAAAVIQQFDATDTLHYVDPPYPKNTRSDAGNDYVFEMSDEEHRELSTVLRAAEGMVVLSGYACPLYDELFYDWCRVERVTRCDSRAERTECLWLNPHARGQLQASQGQGELF